MFKLSSQLCSWLNEAAQPFSEDNTFLIIEAEAPANFEGGIYRIISRGQIVDREGRGGEDSDEKITSVIPAGKGDRK